MSVDVYNGLMYVPSIYFAPVDLRSEITVNRKLCTRVSHPQTNLDNWDTRSMYQYNLFSFLFLLFTNSPPCTHTEPSTSLLCTYSSWNLCEELAQVQENVILFMTSHNVHVHASCILYMYNASFKNGQRCYICWLVCMCVCLSVFICNV